MLEDYFARPRTVDRIRGLWLGPIIEQYAEWLTQQQAAVSTVKATVQRLVRFNHFALARGASTWDQLPDIADAFIAQWIQEHSDFCRTAQDRATVRSQVQRPVEGVLRLLLPSYQLSQRETPLPFAASAPGFFPHLVEERGLRPDTVHQYRYHLRAFEAYLEETDSLDLASLTPTIINKFIVQRAKTLAPSGVGGCGRGALPQILARRCREGALTNRRRSLAVSAKPT